MAIDYLDIFLRPGLVDFDLLRQKLPLPSEEHKSNEELINYNEIYDIVSTMETYDLKNVKTSWSNFLEKPDIPTIVDIIGADAFYYLAITSKGIKEVV